MVAQEVGKKAKKNRIAEDHRHGDAQDALGLALAVGQHAFGIVEVRERLAALIEVVASLRRQCELSRRPLYQCHAELLFEIGNPPADRRHWHRKRACSPGKAAELRDRDKDRDLVEVGHVEILSLLQNRFHHFPSHGNSSKARHSLSFAKTRSRDWTMGERRARHGEQCLSYSLCWARCARRSKPAPTSRSRTWRSGNNLPCSAADRSDHNSDASIASSGCGSQTSGLGGERRSTSFAPRP